MLIIFIILIAADAVVEWMGKGCVSAYWWNWIRSIHILLLFFFLLNLIMLLPVFYLLWFVHCQQRLIFLKHFTCHLLHCLLQRRHTIISSPEIWVGEAIWVRVLWRGIGSLFESISLIILIRLELIRLMPLSCWMSCWLRKFLRLKLHIPINLTIIQ